MKYLLAPSSEVMINDTLDCVDAYLLGIEGLSVNLPFYVSIENIEDIVKKLKEQKKEVFISLNKNMFKEDLSVLEDVLERLEKLDIEGICYYDISVVSIVKRRNFNLPLVWHQEHFTTNYETINYWLSNGVKTTFLSSEITLEEVLEIKENTSSRLIMQVFGYVPMFYSKRPLITNYKKYFNLEDNSTIYYMEKIGLKYPLKETKEGFEGYDAKILNAYKEVQEINLDYIYFNSFMIDQKKMKQVVMCYKNKDQSLLETLYPLESGFLNKKTVYRVKDL